MAENKSTLSYTAEEIDKAIGDVSVMQSDIEKLEAKVEDTGWHDMVLLNGAEISDTRTPQYRKIGNIVFLRGAIIPNSTGLVKFAVLPAGYSPKIMPVYKSTRAVSPDSSLNRQISINVGTGNLYIGAASSGTATEAHFIDTSFIANN